MTTYTINEHYLEGQHGPMRYWASAPQHGLPVVLIHGYGAMIEHWRAVMRPIAARHSLTAVDLHYFGQSAIPSVPPSRKLWADQVAELIATTCAGPAIVVGHSMGGMVAAQLAQDYPWLVRGLVLANSTGLNDPQNQPSAFDQAIFGLIRSSGVGDILAGLVGNRVGAQQGLRSAYYRKERVTPALVEQFTAPLRRPGGPQAYLAVSRAFPTLFLDAKPGSITAPTLLLWGEHDGAVPPALAAYFQRMLVPQADIVILPDVGHCPFDEDPDAFATTLLAWIERLVIDSSL